VVKADVCDLGVHLERQRLRTFPLRQFDDPVLSSEQGNELKEPRIPEAFRFVTHNGGIAIFAWVWVGTLKSRAVRRGK
jgi:hypothetical protein